MFHKHHKYLADYMNMYLYVQGRERELYCTTHERVVAVLGYSSITPFFWFQQKQLECFTLDLHQESTR